MKSFNGHKSWNAWNVHLWLTNEEWSYNLMRDCIRNSRNRRRAAQKMLSLLPSKTPDGAKYNITCVMEAMRGIEE